MKTILTTIFAITVMVFAFNANPVKAKVSHGSNFDTWANCPDSKLKMNRERNKWICTAEKLNELDNLEHADNERDIADSGEEGSTSAASTDDQ